MLAVVAVSVTLMFRGSLPALDGHARLDVLAERVVVERDARGIPMVRATSLLDLVRATGYLHAQDRFFQMDLLRRSAAGELAELFGSAAVNSDRYLRVHLFRARAQAALAAEPPERAALIEAYADGVNAGLDALRVRPFEYWILRSRPEPWLPEDTLLIVYAMYLDLQEERNQTDLTRNAIRQSLSPSMARLLLAEGSPWDAPLSGEALPFPALPGAEDLDAVPAPPEAPGEIDALREKGSNAMAIGGRRSHHGGAILANDMHLNLRVPNIWYPMRWQWSEGDVARSALGMTLPGAPALVIGSNGFVAWGFTNSYVDAADLVALVDADDLGYQGPNGRVEFERHREVIRVKGADPVELEVLWTEFGPVVGEDGAYAAQWVAHEAEGANLRLSDLLDARTLEQAIGVAHSSGIPAQNVVFAAADGRIAWTLAGRLPRRSFDGRFPVASDDPRARWDGFHPGPAVPAVVEPETGHLWSANMRHVCCEEYERIGNGGYSLAARASQIRDALASVRVASEDDLLAVQLDDRALFLSRWRALLVEHLEAAGADSAIIRRVRDDSGRASVQSTGYPLVRAFRLGVHGRLLDAWTAAAATTQGFDRRYLPAQVEEAVWQAVQHRPPHLLPAGYEDWDALLGAAWGGVADPGSWGDRNRVLMEHPLSSALPFLARWLDMPQDPVAGDSRMPRMQSPGFGASERMVVSPGREDDALFHMPGGVSGHPLSPFYRAGHDDWLHGRATRFVGEAVHRLELQGS